MIADFLQLHTRTCKYSGLCRCFELILLVLKSLIFFFFSLSTTRRGHNTAPHSTSLSLEQSECPPARCSVAEFRCHDCWPCPVIHPSSYLQHLFLRNVGRVFVTYEADDDKHVNEIINFVALLRHNGFDTHVCRVSSWLQKS